ncbi:MAG: hypothetical protein IJ064_07710 [Bacteroidaceae bacterium]|nr:hypothetical protein [Bacteroidaceae bacterium]
MKILTTLCMLAIGGNMMGQGFLINYKDGHKVEWNYNDFDSIVVDYASQSKTFDRYRTLPVAMRENPGIAIFTEALFLTGLDAEMSAWRDETWNPSPYDGKSLYMMGTLWDYCHVPEQRLIRFTVFATPDEVLRSRYGITSVQGLYDYARSLYGGESLDVTNVGNRDKLCLSSNPLRRLLAYHCLKSCPANYDMYTTICTIATELVNPTEWYATLDDENLLKMERLTVPGEIGAAEHRNDLYLNRSKKDAVAGVHVARPDASNDDYWAVNGAYYLTDGLADFSSQTQSTVFNTRIRMDLYTLFPEMMNNDIRDGRTANHVTDSYNPDKTVTSPNYWFPDGYVSNVKVPDGATFMFQSQHNTYWSYEGDEFNVYAENPADIDMTLRLPKLPDGEYQLRLGFSDMSVRPIVQCYFDDMPVGIPVDMRDNNFVSRTGWFALSESGHSDADLRAMHNMGWYHGPASVFCIVGEGHPDGASDVQRNYFCDISHTVRYVVDVFQFKEGEQHTLRLRNVHTDNYAIQLDYLEFVPKEIYEGDEDHY